MANELNPQLVTQFSAQLAEEAPRIRAALPPHMNDTHFRAAVLNCFRTSANLQACTPPSIIDSVLAAAACGLAPLNGHAFLVPYYNKDQRAYICSFVPGWKGLVHLVVQSGKAIVSTCVALDGDHFVAHLGTSGQIEHIPLAPEHEAAWLEASGKKVRTITHAYAVGRILGFENFPIVEAWPLVKLLKHRDKYNKQGPKHYSFREEEMYFRKVVLLQVLKVLPQTPQLANAQAASIAAETGAPMVIDGNVVSVEGADDYFSDDLGADEAPPQRPAPRARSQAVAEEVLQRAAGAAPRPSRAAQADPTTGELREPAPSRQEAPPVPLSATGLAWLRARIAEGRLDERALLREHGLRALEDMPAPVFTAVRKQYQQAIA